MPLCERGGCYQHCSHAERHCQRSATLESPKGPLQRVWSKGQASGQEPLGCKGSTCTWEELVCRGAWLVGSKDEACSCCRVAAGKTYLSFCYFLIQRETVMLLVSPVLREAKDRATFGNDSCHQAPRLVSGENWVLKVASEKPNRGNGSRWIFVTTSHRWLHFQNNSKSKTLATF